MAGMLLEEEEEEKEGVVHKHVTRYQLLLFLTLYI
jgi:hypothetical protein